MTEMFKYIIDLLIAPIAYLRFNVAKFYFLALRKYFSNIWYLENSVAQLLDFVIIW